MKSIYFKKKTLMCLTDSGTHIKVLPFDEKYLFHLIALGWLAWKSVFATLYWKGGSECRGSLLSLWHPIEGVFIYWASELSLPRPPCWSNSRDMDNLLECHLCPLDVRPNCGCAKLRAGLLRYMCGLSSRLSNSHFKHEKIRHEYFQHLFVAFRTISP